MNDYVPEDADIRSPSPEPIYDKDGKGLTPEKSEKEMPSSEKGSPSLRTA